MSTSILTLLLFSILSIETESNTMDAPNNFQLLVYKNDSENQLSNSRNEWDYKIFPRSTSSSPEDTRSTGNAINDTPKRRSRFLGGLAFLAGLGMGGLASAASSSVKSLSKLPQASVTLNVGPSRITPYFTAYYDPYSLIQHHYFYPNSFGLYPFIDPAKLQSQAITGPLQNPATTQNQVTPEIVNILDNKRPSDIQNEEEEEYIVENKKADCTKTSINVPEEMADQDQLEVQSAEHEEQKTTTISIPYTEKHHPKKATGHSKHTPKVRNEEQEDDLEVITDSDESSNTRAETTTSLIFAPTTTMRATNVTTTVATTTTTTTTAKPVQNATTNGTDYPPYFGYYGGNPQPINHYEFTTEQYPDYNQVYYGLPSDKPANFHPYEPYPAYQNPQSFFSSDSSSYLPDSSVADFFNSDRPTYNPENVSPYVSGFRPNYYRSL